MSHANRRRESAFTAVELLVTLFVAAAFLVAGYQLFSVVVREGGATRAEAKAANYAYELLRRYSTYADAPCTTQTPLNNSTATVDGLVNVRTTVTITCPTINSSSVSKIEAIVRYNDPQQTVRYGTYVSAAENSSLMNGLIAWWRLNGNATTAVGDANGTMIDTTPTTGQNGEAGGALSFNGTSSYINIPHRSSLNIGNTMSISAWVRPTDLSSRHGVFSTRSNNATDSWQLDVGLGNGGSGRATFSKQGVWIFDSIDGRIALNAWRHVVYVRSAASTSGSMYVNGSLVSSSETSTTTIANNSDPKRIGQGTAGTQFFQGSIDDVRLYNRALTQTEISALYNEGAQ